MTEETNANRGAKMLLMAACLVIVVAGLRAASSVFLPLLVAMFLAAISTPLVALLIRLHVPRFVAVGLATASSLLLVLALALMAAGPVNRFVAQQSEFVKQLDEKDDWLDQQLESKFPSLHSLTTRLWKRPNEEQSDTYREDQSETYRQIFGFAAQAMLSLMSLASNALLILLLQFFILAEAVTLPATLRAALGESFVKPDRLASMAQSVQQYFGLKTAISLGTGVLVSLFLYLCGLDGYLLWGVVAFLLNYIPTIGSIMAAVPPTLVALVQYDAARAAAVVCGFVVVNVVIGNIIEPRLMGRKMQLSPLVVFISMIFWGWVWGPVGMLLSVPLTMLVKILLENTDDLRWVAVMLAGGEAPNMRLDSQ